MSNTNRFMSDFLNGLADLQTYGSDPMTVESLRDEFEVFRVSDDEMEGLISI